MNLKCLRMERMATFCPLFQILRSTRRAEPALFNVPGGCTPSGFDRTPSCERQTEGGLTTLTLSLNSPVDHPERPGTWSTCETMLSWMMTRSTRWKTKQRRLPRLSQSERYSSHYRQSPDSAACTLSTAIRVVAQSSAVRLCTARDAASRTTSTASESEVRETISSPRLGTKTLSCSADSASTSIAARTKMPPSTAHASCARMAARPARPLPRRRRLARKKSCERRMAVPTRSRPFRQNS